MAIYKKVIVWGYPLHTHTHSYVHYGWQKVFAAMGYEVHWFHDGDHPSESAFDYDNCLFITEGMADGRIPIRATSMYIVHACIHPGRYVGRCARMVDLRYHVRYLRDQTYNYSLEDKISAGAVVPLREGSPMWYEPAATSADLSPQHAVAGLAPYEAIYLFWATDLLPHEIRYEDRLLAPADPPKTVFVGSIDGYGGNSGEVARFRAGCDRHGIRFEHVNPWGKAASFEENRRLCQESIIAPDIRGNGNPRSQHKTIGYVPCRLFKNISYGRLGATNCRRLQELFGDMVVCEEDEGRLVDACMARRGDTDYVLRQMQWVAENHTYAQRVEDLLALLALRGDSLAARA